VAIAFVNGGFADNTTGTAQTSLTYKPTWASTAGNVLVVFISCAIYTTAPTLSVSDSANGAYTDSGAGAIKDTVSGQLCQIQCFYRANIATAAANTNTITLSLSGAGSSYPEIICGEFSGAATSGPIDATGHATFSVNGGSGAVSVTTGHNGDMAVTGFVNGNSGWSGVSGAWNDTTAPTTLGNISCYQLIATAAPVTCTPIAAGTTTSYAAVAISLSATSSGGGAQTVNATGFANTQAFGTPLLTQIITLSGIASTNAFGSPLLTQIITPSGIASTNAFGTPIVSIPSPQTISPTGLGSTNAFGTPAISVPAARNEIATDIVFTDQNDGGITAKKLNLSWRDAVIQPAFFSDKPTTSASGTGDYLLLLQASGNYARIAPGALAGSVTPGTWTPLSYGTGWSQNTVAQYRVETMGSLSMLYCAGIINYVSGAASLAFTLPTGARPSVQRGCVLAGYDSSGDVQSFLATVSTAGTVNIFPLVRQAFSWPSATNGSVYLDNLTFAL
jgi:hypothetical protein